MTVAARRGHVIDLPGGKHGRPLIDIADDLGVSVRTLKRWRVKTRLVSGMLYGEDEDAREILAAGFRRPGEPSTKPKLKHRRARG